MNKQKFSAENIMSDQAWPNCWYFLLNDTSQSNRPIEVDNNQMNILLENIQFYTIWQIANIMKISKVRFIGQYLNFNFFYPYCVKKRWVIALQHQTKLMGGYLGTYQHMMRISIRNTLQSNNHFAGIMSASTTRDRRVKDKNKKIQTLGLRLQNYTTWLSKRQVT